MADDILKEGVEAFELCVTTEADYRATALTDIRFGRLEEQWPEQIRKQRELEGRPCLTMNKLAAFRRLVVNNARQNRPQINVHPADDKADPAVAQVYAGLIRNIEYCSDADTAYDTALEAAVDGGLGYFEINTAFASDDSFDLDIRIQEITNQFSVWGDPYSTRHDSADWNLAFQVDTLKTADFKKLFKGAQASNWEAYDYSALSAPWLDGEEVMLAKYWKRTEVPRTIVALSNGEVVGEDDYLANMDLFDATQVEVIGERKVMSHKVMCYLMSGAEVLEERDWAGRYIPIIPVYGDVIHLEGRRYLRSLIHSAIDGQRKFNYDRSMSTELTSLAPKVPFIGPKGAFKTDADKWATANSESHAYIEYDVVAGAAGAAPQRQAWAGPAAGAIQEAELASQDMKDILGIHDASLGDQDPREASGRAILARQKKGDLSSFHLTDNLNRAIRHAGRVIIDLIPTTYTGPRMARVLDPTGIPSLIAVNQPTQVPHGPNGQPMIAQPMMGLDPGQLQTIQKTLDLAVGKYDIAVEPGPSYTTRREEAAGQMIEVMQAFPEAAQVLAPMLAKNLDWPGADQIAPALQQLQQGGQNKAEQEAQAAQAKAEAEGKVKMATLQQEGQLKQQQAVADHQLALQQQQQEMELERAKQAGQLALQRESQQQTIQLQREKAEADFQLAQWTAEQSVKLKAIEIAHRAEQTIELPDDEINSDIG